ncbi:ATP-binding protein [Candidatus Omnitrophota bacterium]
MPKIEINSEKCKGCELCILYCKRGLIKQKESVNKKGVYPVLFLDKDDKCTGCSFCATICPECCITVYK